MLFDLQESEREGWRIVAVVGDVDLATAPRVRAGVVRAFGRASGPEAAPHDAPPRVIVDLSAVDLIDSSGLGVIIGAQRRARQGAGALRVVVTSERVHALLRLCELDRILDIRESLADALAAPVPARRPADAPTLSEATRG